MPLRIIPGGKAWPPGNTGKRFLRISHSRRAEGSCAQPQTCGDRANHSLPPAIPAGPRWLSGFSMTGCALKSPTIRALQGTSRCSPVRIFMFSFSGGLAAHYHREQHCSSWRALFLHGENQLSSSYYSIFYCQGATAGKMQISEEGSSHCHSSAFG